MKGSKWFGAASAAVVLGSVVVFAAKPTKPDATGAGAGTTESPSAARRTRLTKPWNEMTSLTDTEKTKILEIHHKAVEDIHKIEVKEREDIEALLTPAQKDELKQVEEKDAETRRARQRNNGPTTQRSTPGGTSSGAPTAKP